MLASLGRAVGGVIIKLMALAAGAWLLIRYGREQQRLRGVQTNSEIKDVQLKAAANSPRTRDELVDRLRGKGDL
ncbi:MAG: hypothetical protein ACE5EM_13165 [Sphingomonadales bacterium]